MSQSKGCSIDMTITYLIGNGFDIGLGLRTSYQSFLEWYLQQTTNSREEEWLKEQMKNAPDLWSDAELAFGKLPFSDMNGDALGTFERCYDLFTGAFYKYIKGENDRLLVPSDLQQDIASRFLKNVLGMDSWMMESCANDFQSRMKNDSVTLQFVSFNYTDALEKILGMKMGEAHEFTIEKTKGREMKVFVGDIVHAHGTLTDNYVFGVDEPKQIADEKVRASCGRKGGLLKALSAEKVGLQDRKRALSKLTNSEMIVTYGLSFGETDHSWWDAVYRTFAGRNVPIVICPYRMDAPTSGRSAGWQNEFYDQEKKRLFATLIKRRPAIQEAIESISSPRIIVLRPDKIGDGYGKLNKCDYLQLAYIGKKCIAKRSEVSR